MVLKLSVIILNYKVPSHLLLCLDSVTKATANLDAEIIVVDNNSQDQSCTMVKEHYPDVEIIENEKNFGFSKGNNIGAEKASGEFLCILNPDTVVPEDCFNTLLSSYSQLENPGALGVQLIDGSGEFLEESKRNIPTPRVALKKLLGNCSSYYNNQINRDESGPTNILVGAFMFMKKELFLNIGGFDEDYFMYGEDIDLSYRIHQAGFQNYYIGSCKVLHYKGESTTKDQVYLNRFFNAMYIFFKKHFKNYQNSFKLVKLSLKLTMSFEKMRLKSIKSKKHNIKKVYLISKDACLKSLIERTFTQTLSIHESIDKSLENHFIVLDAEHLSYKNCIHTLISLKAKNNSFRIKPRNHKFMIGSESKHTKGEVIELELRNEYLRI